MSADIWGHSLSFVVRFRNHFTGEPVNDELPVRLADTLTKPVTNNTGAGLRQADGSYRFIDLPGGTHSVRWLPPFTNSYLGWMTLEANLQVNLPLADPAQMIEQDLWPSPHAAVPGSITAVRGKLRGVNIQGLRVVIAPPAGPRPHYSRTDTVGEFLFLLPAPLTPNVQGLLNLRLEVEDGARVVNGGEIHPSGASFVGADFSIRPSVCSRIIYQIT